jgi:hypothetical protein
MITFKQTGSFAKTERMLNKALNGNPQRILEIYGREGVIALASATPKDTGETAYSWDYEIQTTPTGYNLIWTNSNVVSGVPVVILIQYGHGTGSGGYVEGRDFINPALRSIFDRIASKLYEEVA